MNIYESDSNSLSSSTDNDVKPEQSGWSKIPTTKKLDLDSSDDENQQVEQKIYSEPDNPVVRQETGGPDKPTA